MPEERVLTIRQPSTANLLVDSADRNPAYASPFDFQIVKPNSIMNGFFTRVGTTEVVLNWCEPNITSSASRLNNTVTLDLSGTGANTYVGTQTVTLQDGHYTVKEALDDLVDELNDLSGTTGITFAITAGNGGTFLTSTDGVFRILVASQGGSALAQQLDIVSAIFVDTRIIRCPDIRPYRYIDFVSQQLTYNQELKDATTNSLVRDVLCRWYFADDVPEALDAYGFPILMGYKTFCRRRIFSPPKQITWSNNIPVGNISFQVYGWAPTVGLTSVPITQVGQMNTNWLMTLQMSEN